MILPLSGQWLLKNKSYSVPGNVPGDVTDDLYRAGVVGDPYFGDNYKSCGWATREDWTYEREFVIDDLSLLSEETYIRLEGVDTFSDVWVNGTRVGATRSMHREYRFPVNGLLKEGKNRIAVELYNVYDQMGAEEQTKYDSIFCANRIFVRKAQCHFGWDWAPQFPGYGIYRDVSLVSEKKCAVREASVQADINGDVTFRIAFGDKFEGEVEVSVSFEGKEVARATRKAACKKLIVNLRVGEPKLWWPNGYGEQPIYDYTVRQLSGDEKTEYKGRFGFRRIELERKVLDGSNLGFGFKINGREIFCRGSNWVPAECMTGRLKDEKYYALLKAAKDANINMLRVWGGGIYEKDCFYDYCDRMGIMIWQDFMFSCSELPEDDPDFLREITDEAVWQVKRLRNHPCMTYWCGMNEIRGAFCELEERYSAFTLHYLLRGITAELSPDIPYERTSPYCFADTENDVSEGDCHNNLSEVCLFDASFKGFDKFEYDPQKERSALKERIKNYERYLEGTVSNFSSECAVLGMCNYGSLVKFTPEEQLRLDSDFFEKRFLGNPYTYVMPTFYERQKTLAEAMYGRAESLKELVKKANKAQADIIKTEIVYCRVNGRSRGFLNWMYNDIWPTGTWSVVDYYLSEKPAYYEMKRCFRPLMAEIIRIGDKYYLCLANDGAEPLAVSAETGTKKYCGESVSKALFEGSVSAGGSLKAELNAAAGDYLFASGTFGGVPFCATYDLGRYREEPLKPKYSVSVKETGEGVYEAEVRAESFLPCFKISAGENAEVSDNFFDMAAGEVKRVEIRTKESPGRFAYATFADEWND